jgi:hypothetical protein
MELIKLGESFGFSAEFTQVQEITGYHNHNGEAIATSGSGWSVGTKKDANGFYDRGEAAHFDDLDSAKAFIDGGKTGEHTTVAKKFGWDKPAVQESFIDLISTDKTAAEQRFKQIMSEKVAHALAARRVEIAQSLYSRVRGE